MLRKCAMRNGDVVADRFAIERVAGRGGMGEVYRAMDQSTGQPVAIKVLLGEEHGDTARFAREARMLSSVEHPGVVRHVAHGALASGNPYLVMEWLDGEDLSARLSRAPLDPEDVVSLIRNVADALGAMHTRGIVHRDLKPSNIFLPDKRIEMAKLLDFGIATSQTVSRLTQTGMVLGTASYMAPEQATGVTTIDARADVFSLGCVFYECLVGEPAWTGAHIAAILAKILFSDPPSLRERCPGLPESLYVLVDSMLSKLPEDRPVNGHAVAAALRDLGPIVVSAHAPTVEMQCPQALTGSEQRAAALILIGPASGDDPHDDTGLATEAGVHGGRFERLFDGSAVVLISDASVATDLGAQAAFCALALKRLAPKRRFALSFGWNDTTGRLPLGPTIDRAAKLVDEKAAATTEHILLDEAAVGLLEARFEVFKADGLCILRGERDVTDVRTLLGKPTPFVGRDRDLRRIEDFFDDCIADQRATATLVTAPAGMGKSRLGREIVYKLRARGDGLSIWIARGQLLGAGSALGMLSELVQTACGIRGGESIDGRREKIVAAVDQCVPDAQRPRVAAFLGEVIGARFSEEGNAQLFAARRDAQLMSDLVREAFVDFARAKCSQLPLLILLEDLHWGDGATVRILDAALRELGGQPLFVLALARPEVHELFPKLWSDRHLHVVRLNQLGKKACEDLVKYVLGGSTRPELVERITRLADGNAFYLEELIRATNEGKSDDLPETVVAMVQSRLARLDDLSRRVLRAASVFGEVFWPGGVAMLVGVRTTGSIVGETMRVLVEEEVVTLRRESRFAGESEYAFRHALLREGAYAMLTEEDNRLGHRLAGEWLEVHGESDPLVLAEHFENGGEGGKAAVWYLRAADAACQGGDSETALRRVEQGLAAGPAQGIRLELLGIYCEAAAWALSGMERASELANVVLEHAPPGSIPWARAAFMKIVDCAFRADVASLLATIPNLLKAEPEHGSRRLMLVMISTAACFIDMIGMTRAGTDIMQRAVEISSAAKGDRMANAALARFQSIRHSYADENPWLALQNSKNAYEGHPRLDASSFVGEGLALSYLGKVDEARSAWAKIVIGDADFGYMSSYRPFMESLLFADHGNLGDARQRAAHLLNIGTSFNRPLDESRGHWILGEILRRSGEYDEAEREIHTALAKVIPLDKPGVLATLAALRLAQGKTTEALAAAEEGMQKYEEMRACSMFMRGGFLRVVHIECLLAAKREDDAKLAISKAKDWLFAIAAKIGEEEYRTSFLQSVPENRRIQELAASWLPDA